MHTSPAILAKTVKDFSSKISSPLMDIVTDVHIDVMDGTFTHQTCISHPDLIPSSFSPDIELHLMVTSPLSYIQQWSTVPQFKRALIHIESAADITRAILFARDLDLEIFLAINPQTSLADLSRYANHVDGFLVMGVIPGASGQSFIGESILSRISSLRSSYPSHVISVDGGMNLDTAKQVVSSGADQLCASSSIWGTDLDPVAAYQRFSFI